jgi:hypothetical protein
MLLCGPGKHQQRCCTVSGSSAANIMKQLLQPLGCLLSGGSKRCIALINVTTYVT